MVALVLPFDQRELNRADLALALPARAHARRNARQLRALLAQLEPHRGRESDRSRALAHRREAALDALELRRRFRELRVRVFDADGHAFGARAQLRQFGVTFG